MQTISDSAVIDAPLPKLDAPGDDHLDNFEEFFEHLNRAAKSVLPRVSRRHSGVYVLLLRWEDDDLGTESEVTELEKVFRDVYHYSTERYLIPSSDPTTQLEYKLNDFRRAYDNETNLLIIYYGGHGVLEYSKHRPSRSIWQAKQIGGATLIWSDLQGVLERAKSDVIFILDCCFAANATRCAGSKEGLWACNSEVTTTGVNDNSFTRNLIAELSSLSTSRFNITMLHAKLMRRYRMPGTHMLLTEPWYTYLGDIAVPSIELVPQLPHHMDSINSSNNTTEAQNLMSNDSSGIAPLAIDRSMTETLVLLAVRLKDTERIPKLLSWQDWCHDLAPDEIESVHALGRLQIRDLVRLEAHFLSNSALILVSMPVFIWDRLARNPSYSFVGFIKSANLLFPSWNPQLEIFLNSSTNIEDWARVQTIEELSEADGNYLSREDLESKANLAVTYESQGSWKEAEYLYLQVIETRRKVLGAEHPDTLTSMNNLAATFSKQGRWGEAENLETQVIEARKRVLGAEHPSTLTSLGNLASIYRNQGRWNLAQELEIEAMKAFKRVLGADHPSTLTSMANLSSTFWSQGRWKEAEALEIEVMETRNRVIGKEHPDTLTSMNNLAGIWESQGKYDKAEPMFRQTLQLTEKVLGKEHPDTLTIMNNLAGLFKSQGRYDEAKPLYQRTLQLTEKVLGKEHPDTLTVMNNLAGLLKSQGRYDEAEPIYQQMLQLKEKVLGKEHPSTLMSMNNLAGLLKSQGRYNEAESIYRQTLLLTEKVLGKEHPDTLKSMNNLAGLLQSQVKYSSDLAGYLNNLGNKLESRYERTRDIADLEEAIEVARQAVASTPQDHADLAGCLNNLGNKLESRYERTRDMADLEEAIKVARQAVALTPKDDSDLAGRLNNLETKLDTKGY